jgi:hypothetical protein
MRVLAALLLTLSLPGAKLSQPLRTPTNPTAPAAARSHTSGKWYFAQTGHAVFCYGPVMLVTLPKGGLQRVATFCKGDQAMVPLKD